MHKCKKQQQKDGSVVHEVVFFDGEKMWFIRNEFFSVLAVDAIVLPMPKNCEHR